MKSFCFILYVLFAALSPSSFGQTSNQAAMRHTANVVVYSGISLLGSAVARNLDARNPQLWGCAASASVLILVESVVNKPTLGNIASGFAGITVSVPIEKLFVKPHDRAPLHPAPWNKEKHFKLKNHGLTH
jgi:hypothetical protein